METASGEGDFRMMRRCVADAILQLGESNRYTKGIFAYVGFRTSWIEYENVARSIGESKWNLRGLLRYAAQGIFAFSDAPLKIAGPLGTGLVFLSVLTLLLPQTQHAILPIACRCFCPGCSFWYCRQSGPISRGHIGKSNRGRSISCANAAHTRENAANEP